MSLAYNRSIDILVCFSRIKQKSCGLIGNPSHRRATVRITDSPLGNSSSRIRIRELEQATAHTYICFECLQHKGSTFLKQKCITAIHANHDRFFHFKQVQCQQILRKVVSSTTTSCAPLMVCRLAHFKREVCVAIRMIRDTTTCIYSVSEVILCVLPYLSWKATPPFYF